MYPAVYDRAILLDKLWNVSWPENVDWIHKFTLDYSQKKEVDVNDDLNQELSFYNQALDNTREAFTKLKFNEYFFLKAYRLLC